ncbi:MAG: hypothetical protein AB9866_18950 [Syntrophobacteraceae bacterium]
MKQEFKVGDRVKLISERYDDDIYNPLWGGSQGKVTGKVERIRPDGHIRVEWDNGIGNSYLPEDLELINTWKQGDILINGDGKERKVLAVLGEICFTSKENNFSRATCGNYTQKELEDAGWKLKTPEDEFVEIVGKKYDRKAVEERLKELDPIE